MSFSSRFVCTVVFVVVMCVGVVGVALDVHAQDQGQGIIQMQENQMGNDERAKAHFRVGTSLYEAGRFNEAAEEWQKAFELSQRSELLYNVYVAYRDAATSNDKAIGALRRYLELGTIEATRRLQLEARLRAMEEAQAQAAQNAAPAPVAEPAPVVESAAPVIAADSAQGSSPSNVGPIVLMASGGALLVASVITGVMANGVESDLEDKCPDNLCPADVDLEGERDKGNTLIALNAITGVAGVLALGTGVVWMLMNGGSDEATAPTPAVSFGCGVNGCAGQVTTRF